MRHRGPSPKPPAARSPFQADIHRLQLELFAANQQLINAAVEGYTGEFRRYEARYRRTVHDVAGPSRFAALVRRTRQARAVLVGDYHTLAVAQRTFLRLLRGQPAGDRDVVVALEMFPGHQDRAIARFLEGQITERTFLRRIDHARRWPFGPLDVIRPVLELATARGWRVIGLDRPELGASSLSSRDRYAAERITECLAARPSARVFALIGEMHLAPPHLPRALGRAFARRRVQGEVLRVHQNPERIWFEQNARGVVDEHDVLELGPRAFAVLTASPVVCQQSFLTWLEQFQDGLDGSAPLDIDAGERSFRQAVQILGRALKLPVRDALRKVEVVGPADLSFFARLRRSGQFSPREMRQIRAHILSSESCYLPKARLVYLATLSLNHAAEEASHYLRHHFSREGLDEPRGMVDAFYCRVLNEAIGFMGSKIVNPKRKGVHPTELTALATAPPDERGPATIGGEERPVRPLDLDAARFVLGHKRMERGETVPWLTEVFIAGADMFNAVTHILGYMLGDQLYYGLVRGRLSPKLARQLYFESFEEEGAALARYLDLVARVGRLRTPRP